VVNEIIGIADDSIKALGFEELRRAKLKVFELLKGRQL